MRLTPRNTSFFDLLATSAGHLVTGADLLSQLLGAERKARVEISAQLRDAEHAADESTHSIMRRLNQTFVTPFDRHDIYALASGLDDCMDHMEEAGDLIVLYKLDVLPELVNDQVDVLRRCAELTADAMPRLKSMKDLAEYWVEINRLENEADRAHQAAVRRLFEEEQNPVAIIKWKEILDFLEAATDRCEDVANVLEGVVVKHA